MHVARYLKIWKAGNKNANSTDQYNALCLQNKLSCYHLEALKLCRSCQSQPIGQFSLWLKAHRTSHPSMKGRSLTNNLAMDPDLLSGRWVGPNQVWRFPGHSLWAVRPSFPSAIHAGVSPKSSQKFWMGFLAAFWLKLVRWSSTRFLASAIHPHLKRYILLFILKSG